MLVIVAPHRTMLIEVIRQELGASQEIEIIVDRRRRERRTVHRDVLRERRRRNRRQNDVDLELRVTGWAVVRRPVEVRADPIQPWQMPWLRCALLIRTIASTSWDRAVWPTARATLEDALDTRRRLLQEGWFN